MEKDIVPELLDAIKKDFLSDIKNNTAMVRFEGLIKSGTATYKEANDYATWCGQFLSFSYKKHITPEVLPDGKMYYNIAERILNETLKLDHELISAAAETVQNSLNKDAGIGIKAIKPKLNQDRIDGLVDRISTEDDFAKVSWLLDEPVVNFSQSIIDESIRTNAEFHAKAGLKPKIIRREAGNCCDWCKEVVGTYTYPDVPEDVYRRHRYCRCTVDYDPGDGRRQNVWTKEWRDPEKEEKIEARKKIGIKNKS